MIRDKLELRTDEAARLAALHSYEIVDTAPEPPYEKLAQLVRSLLGVPMAAITFIDKDRQFLHDRLAGTRLIQLPKPVKAVPVPTAAKEA